MKTIVLFTLICTLALFSCAEKKSSPKGENDRKGFIVDPPDDDDTPSVKLTTQVFVSEENLDCPEKGRLFLRVGETAVSVGDFLSSVAMDNQELISEWGPIEVYNSCLKEFIKTLRVDR